MNPVKLDLKGKAVVITGYGGVLCSHMAEAMAETGARSAGCVSFLPLNAIGLWTMILILVNWSFSQELQNNQSFSRY